MASPRIGWASRRAAGTRPAWTRRRRGEAARRGRRPRRLPEDRGGASALSGPASGGPPAPPWHAVHDDRERDRSPAGVPGRSLAGARELVEARDLLPAASRITIGPPATTASRRRSCFLMSSPPRSGPGRRWRRDLGVAARADTREIGIEVVDHADRDGIPAARMTTATASPSRGRPGFQAEAMHRPPGGHCG